MLAKAKTAGLTKLEHLAVSFLSPFSHKWLPTKYCDILFEFSYSC